MNSSFLLRFLPLLAAQAKVKPYPGWVLGSQKSESGALLILRKQLWKRLKTPCVIRWLDGLHLYVYPVNEISRAIFLTGYYEPNEFVYLNKFLKPGMTFIDVGANIGLYTLFAAKKVGDQGTVLGIEPSDREFQRLKAHVELNSLSNARLLQVAVSSSRTEAELLVATEKHSGHNTLGAFGYDCVMAQGKEWVHVERLDDIVQQEGLQRVDVIKMDIEGAEFLALQGAEETLAQFHPTMLLELSDRTLKHQGCSSEQVWDFLTQSGYRIYVLDGNTGLPVPAQRSDYFDWTDIIAVHELFEGEWT